MVSRPQYDGWDKNRWDMETKLDQPVRVQYKETISQRNEKRRILKNIISRSWFPQHF